MTASIDSQALFPGLANGASQVATGAVVVMTAAAALGNMDPSIFEKNVIFALLDGEARGYLGSSTMAFEMNNNTFAQHFGAKTGLNIDSIEQIININSVGLNEEKVFLHVEPDRAQSVAEADDLLALFEEFAATLTVAKADNTESGLPPGSSAQSFLRLKRDIPTVVVTDHDEKGFVNKYYGSIFDRPGQFWDGEQVSDAVNKLADIATVVATKAFNYAKKQSVPSRTIDVSREDVFDLLGFYTRSVKRSKYFDAINKDEYFDVATTDPVDAPLNTALRVLSTDWDANPGGMLYSPPTKSAAIASTWAAMVTNRDIDLNEEDCLNEDHKYTMLSKSKNKFWMKKESRCVEATIFGSPSYSQGFDNLPNGEDYANPIVKPDALQNGYPLFTESNWASIKINRVDIVEDDDEISVLLSLLVPIIPTIVCLFVITRFIFTPVEKLAASKVSADELENTTQLD